MSLEEQAEWEFVENINERELKQMVIDLRREITDLKSSINNYENNITDLNKRIEGYEDLILNKLELVAKTDMKVNVPSEWLLQRDNLEEGLEIGAGSLNHLCSSSHYCINNSIYGCDPDGNNNNGQCYDIYEKDKLIKEKCCVCTRCYRNLVLHGFELIIPD